MIACKLTVSTHKQRVGYITSLTIHGAVGACVHGDTTLLASVLDAGLAVVVEIVAVGRAGSGQKQARDNNFKTEHGLI
jgi:hypothetical protein